jgi:hypothetical protein
MVDDSSYTRPSAYQELKAKRDASPFENGRQHRLYLHARYQIDVNFLLNSITVGQDESRCATKHDAAVVVHQLQKDGIDCRLVCEPYCCGWASYDYIFIDLTKPYSGVPKAATPPDPSSDSKEKDKRV